MSAALLETALAGRVLHLILNRPEKRNALNMALCRDLLVALNDAESNPAVGAILLRGNGSAFCAGMDLREVLHAEQSELESLHERLFTHIQRTRKPMIAAVQGAALAAGTGLAANAHIVVASDDARFGLTEARIGLWPVIVFRSVSRAIGERRATELSLTARIFTAAEAAQFGLVTEISADPLSRAKEIAKTVSDYSPAVIATGLDHIAATRGLTWTETTPIDHKIRTGLMASDDFAEGVRAFLEKRPPVWPSTSRPS